MYLLSTIRKNYTDMIVAKDNNDMNNNDNIPALQSPFEQLREVDADGREWWNSRKLARVMGYGKYWNFEHLSDTIQKN